MKKYPRLIFLLFLFLPIFLSACATPFFQSCRDLARNPENEWKYSEQQRQIGVACDHAMRIKAAKFDKEKGIWIFNPDFISVEDMEKVLKDKVDSYNDLLSFRDRELADAVDWFKMRPGLLREEKITRWLLRRINYVSTFNEFTDLVGEIPKDMLGSEAEYLMPYGRKVYSLRMISPSAKQKIPFVAEYLETAKKNNTLVKVDSFFVSDSQTYAKKVESLYDPNEFIWDKQYRGWQVDSYKVISDKERPNDNIVQHIEVFRTKENNKAESLPAMRGFLAAGGQNVSIFLMDYDKEGEQGFGDPDAVKRIFSSITTGRDLFTGSDRDLLYALYDNQNNNLDKPERRRPPEKPVYLEIVPMDKKIDLAVWEEGNWTVPFDYSNFSKNLGIEFTPPKDPAEARIEEKEKLKRILAFVQEFSQYGKKVVIELWIPKKEYAERNIASAQSNDIFRIRRKGGEEKSGDVEFFAQYKKIINYNFGGKWFQIVDEKGNGTFNKKREIADPIAAPSKNDSGGAFGF